MFRRLEAELRESARMIILYNPRSSATRKPILPMSLLALGAVLEGHEDYLIVDGNIEPRPLQQLDRQIRETGAAVLGVTVMPGPQLDDAVPLCRELKTRHPTLQIVWGGYFPTQHVATCLQAPFVDFVVRGHGELVFRDLVGELTRGAEPTDRIGVAYRDRQTDHVVDSGLSRIPHPERLPSFPYHRVDMSRYIRRTFMGDRTIPHHSSYGCPFFCNFCAVVNMVNGAWLPQSAERTAGTVRELVDRFGVNAVEFYDNNFFVHEDRTVEFAERIRPLGIGWWGEARVDTLLKSSERTWRLLTASGLRMVYLGAESGSDATLQRMRKGGTASADKTLEIAALMKSHGIVPEFSFVVGNPPDPEDDARQTLAFIRKLKRINPASEIVMYLYTPVPLQGNLYEQATAAGFRFPNTLEEWTSSSWREFSQRRSGTLPWIEEPLRRELHDFERVLNAYYPTVTDRGLTRAARLVLHAASAWRYRLRWYRYPLELRLLQRLLPYQRPETSGF